MTDIANLGLAVDSKSVTVASGELDDLSRSAKGAQASAGGLKAGSESLARSTQQLSVAAQAAAASERTQSAAMRAATLSANDNAKAFRALGARRQQFIYQSNDVISGLIMGQNPMMVATQQGGQIAQVYGGPGGVAAAFEDAAFFTKGLGTRLVSFAGKLGPVGLGIIGLTATAGALAFMISKNKEEVIDFEDALETLGSTVSDNISAAELAAKTELELAEVYGGSKERVDAYIASLITLREVQSESALTDFQKSIGGVDALSDLRKLIAPQSGGSLGLGSSLGLVALQAETGLTESGIRDVLAAITAVENAKGFEETADTLADLNALIPASGIEFIALKESLLDAEGSAREAIASTGDVADGVSEAAKQAAKDMRDLFDLSASLQGQSDIATSGGGVAEVMVRAEAERANVRAALDKAITSGTESDIFLLVSHAEAALNAIDTKAQAKINDINQKADDQRSASAARQKAEQERVLTARERALAAIGRQEDRLSQRRLSESGREIDLIKARTQESMDSLDALAAQAIANGANEAEVNTRVNIARRDAIIAADQEIYSFRQAQIEKELQDQIDAAKRAAEVKKQIEQFNSGLASQGVFGPADISGSPFANQAQGLGSGAVEGIGGVLQQEQERLAQLQEFENQKRAIIGNNQAEILAMEAQFEATRAAIKQDSLEQQTAIIQQSKEQLAAGVANDLGALTNAMGSILGEQSDAYQAALAVQKAAAFASALIAAPAAASQVMGDPTLPFFAKITAAAAIYANVVALGAQIGQVAIGGRQFGGATTGGTPYEINEDGRPEIYQQGNKKYLLSGSNGQVTPEPRMQQAANDRSGGGVNIQIVNNGSGVAVRKESLSNGDVRMIIEDMVPSMIAQEAPQVMAKQVSNANSTFSNAMTQNTQTARRRP
jgi:hypothetical protein